MFTASDEHMPYIIQLYIMSIHPVNKAADQERETDRERQTERDRQRETERYTHGAR